MRLYDSVQQIRIERETNQILNENNISSTAILEEPIVEIDSPVDSVVHLFSNSNETMFVVEQKGIQTIPLDVSLFNFFRIGGVLKYFGVAWEVL
uniref:Uncharacterized protein n=1 Tax=Meloidogyne incognita TaxID=6306 RepID=A0A914MUQ0_MELIC